MIKIGIVTGSTRPGRNSEAIAQWVYENARHRSDAHFEVVDILDYRLPLLDEPNPPAFKQYTKPHTHDWSKKIDSLDGYVFVTPEYNRATSGALKNAIDFLYQEWGNKAAGFVGYGMSGGFKAIESLRLIMGELSIADVRAEVNISLYTDFENYSVFRPAPYQQERLQRMLNEIVAWGKALKQIRTVQNR